MTALLSKFLISGCLVFFVLAIYSCTQKHEIVVSQEMLSEHFELLNDVQQVFSSKNQEVKMDFVQQYLRTKEHVTYSIGNIYLPDTSEFGRNSYPDFKYVSLTGTKLVNELQQLVDLITTRNTENTYIPNEADHLLFAEVGEFFKGYLEIPNNLQTKEANIHVYLEKLGIQAPSLVYLGYLEAVKLMLIEQIQAVQRRNYSSPIVDYFQELSPFLFIPDAERFIVDTQATLIDYSGRIYAINRYDFNLGLFIKSITINEMSLDYAPENPRYSFALPVVRHAGDSMRIYLEASAITKYR